MLSYFLSNSYNNGRIVQQEKHHSEQPIGAAADRRSIRSRRALLDAAERLFGERGVDAVSIDDLIASADVAKGTFYNHFDDKAALALAVVTSVRADAEALVAARNAGIIDPAQRCARALCVYAHFAAASPVRARALMHIETMTLGPDAAVNRGLRSDIEAGLASGVFHVPDRSAAMLYVSGLAGALIASALIGGDPRRAGEAIVSMCLTGLGMRPDQAGAVAKAAMDDIAGS